MEQNKTRAELRQELLDAQVELEVEESTIERLGTLGKQQKNIFDEQHKARMRMLGIALGMLILVALLAVMLFVVVAKFNRQTEITNELKAQNDRLEQLFTQFKEERSSARIASCKQDNENRIPQHNSLVDSVEALVTLAVVPNPERPRTSDQQATVDQFYSNSITALEKSRVPLRDCSPEGIEAYFN